MPNSGPFPSKDADFNNYLIAAAAHLNANAARLGVSNPNLTSLNTFVNNWNVQYPKSQNPDTATATVTAMKTALRSDIQDLLRTIYADIPESAYTAQDRTVLNHPLSDGIQTPVPVADHAPAVTIDANKHLVVTLRINDPQHPGTNAMPNGQHVELHVAMEPPAGQTMIWDADRSLTVTRFLCDVMFTDADVKQTVWFRLRYVNTKGQPGPWCDKFSTIVM